MQYSCFIGLIDLKDTFSAVSMATCLSVIGIYCIMYGYVNVLIAGRKMQEATLL